MNPRCKSGETEGGVMAEDYKGDLEGNPVPHASFMRCGVCLCGDTVGIDLVDADGKTIAHGHLDVETADRFWRDFGESIVEARAGKTDG